MQRVYALNALFVVLAAWAAWRWFARAHAGDARARRLRLRPRRDEPHVHGGARAGARRSSPCAVEPRAAAPPARAPRPRVAAGLAGLLPYLYLPLRSRADPRLDWGNPETLERFLDVVLRRDFWERAWIEGPRRSRADRGGLGRAAWSSSRPGSGPVLAALALVAARRRGWPVLLPAAGDARQPRVASRCTARAPISSSGTATTSRRTRCWRCSPGSAARC